MTREWHRDGATIYTVKEQEDVRRKPTWIKGPLMVNDNWMQVQGPNAEAVAAEVFDKLMAQAETVELLREAALQIEYLHEKFQATGTGETVVARIRMLLARIETK